MRVKIKKGKCYNYNKIPCKYNDDTEMCITCYVYAGHGTQLKYEEGKRDDNLD